MEDRKWFGHSVTDGRGTRVRFRSSPALTLLCPWTLPSLSPVHCGPAVKAPSVPFPKSPKITLKPSISLCQAEGYYMKISQGLYSFHHLTSGETSGGIFSRLPSSAYSSRRTTVLCNWKLHLSFRWKSNTGSASKSVAQNWDMGYLLFTYSPQHTAVLANVPLN